MEDISKNSVEEGKVAGAIGLGFLGGLVGSLAGPGGTVIGTTLGAALGAILSPTAKEQQRQFQEIQQEFASRGKKYGVYLNGKYVTPELEAVDLFPLGPESLDDYLTKEEAVSLIVKIAKTQHDPNTFFTIKDEIDNQIVWRFKVTDVPKSADDLPKIDEDYKQLARIVELSKK